MGMTVFSQVDPKQYFSISKIDKKAMVENGLKMTVKELREKARKSPYVAEVLTGHPTDEKLRMKVKIYRYADFVDKEGKDDFNQKRLC